jgi:hypothetical protein
MNSIQFWGGKSSRAQTNVWGHMAPGVNGPPQVHWVKSAPVQSAYEIALQPGHESMAM